MKNLGKEIFLIKAKFKHGNEYDYSLVNYINSRIKINIICKEHGLFEQIPNMHLQGQGCSKCGNIKKGLSNRLNNNDFIKRSKEIHNNKYDYSLVNYEKNNIKIKIICPVHGIFTQTPSDHLQGYSCLQCGIDKTIELKRSTKEKFIEKAKKIHGDKFNYSLVKYKNSFTKINIICQNNHSFMQKPTNHLKGDGCLICFNLSNKINQTSFIKKANEKHGNKYDYSLVKYKKYTEKIKIICPIHEEFYQTPKLHLKGTGCPKCNSSLNKSELDLFHFIKKSFPKITIIYQGRPLWLKTSKTNSQSLDIYLPDYNIAIESHGLQHFKPIKWFGGEGAYEITKERDERKRLLCEANGCKLFYFTFLSKKQIKKFNYPIFNKKEKLVEHINSLIYCK